MSARSVASLALTLRQPAQIGDRARSDFVVGTRTHLPGAVVRGAYAARWLSIHSGPAQPGTAARHQFEQLFEGSVRFGPLFHGAAPLPLSVLKHKYEERSDCGHIMVDRALVDRPATTCPGCGSPMEPATSEVDDQVAVRRRTHVSIGETQTATKGQLVSRETLGAGLTFTGMLVADEPALLDELAGLGWVQVGGRRTTHGLAEAQISPGHIPPLPLRHPDGGLVVSLRSPGILVDDWGRPSLDPHLGELGDVLGCRVVVQRRWVRWTSVGGWHVASGLPKPTELAVVAGSTYVLETSRYVDDIALAQLVTRGIGLRRHEGFGEVGGAPDLPQGRVAREAEQQRITRIADSVAALRAFQTSSSWPTLVDRLRSAAHGDAAAVALVHRVAQSWPAPQQQALARLLDLPGVDAAKVLDGWGL